MLKITKGLKKKKKGKKSKHKEEELFDSAELEEYRRQQQEKQKESGEGAQAQPEGEQENHEESEEWLKFKALTSGVDDILKKTQGDLDRIKSTSFFQKKPPGPSASQEVRHEVKPARPERPPPQTKSRWVGFEEGKEDDRSQEEPAQSEPPGNPPEQVEEHVEEEEEESEFEDDQDDIFDTSFVDVVASGEVKLAYVPDSPIEDTAGPDPFDTSIVDRVIKVDPKEQKRSLITLGSAVEVLTGKLDKSPCRELTPSPRKRPKAQDLLLGSFDEGDGKFVVEGIAEPPPKSILDDDPVFEEETSAVLGFPPVTPLIENKAICTPAFTPVKDEKSRVKSFDLKELVEEFIPTTSDLAVSSSGVEKDEFDDEFEALAAESLSKKPPPPPRTQPPPSNLQEDEDDDVFIDGDDPFDTTFATQVLPGKFELKLIEKEILDSDVPVNNNSVEEQINCVLRSSEPTIRLPKSNEPDSLASEFAPLSIKHRDLLGGSTTDLTKIDQPAIAPKSLSEEPVFENVDPFDTSIADVHAVLGKTELKFLEKELLDQNKLPTKVDSDDEFDPRAEEKQAKVLIRPDNLSFGKRTSVPKVVAFDVAFAKDPADLLTVGQEENSKHSKPLTPYYAPKSADEAKTAEEDADPFDTSYVTNRPGKVELQILEKELAFEEKQKLKHSISDPEFDPRSGLETAKPVDLPDILTSEVVSDLKLHTPVTPRKFVEEPTKSDDFDPFDTSITNTLVPGKAEIKLLEKELKEAPPIPNPPSSAILERLRRDSESFSSLRKSPITDVLELHVEDTSVKPLTPLAVSSSFDQDDIDPFDTSCVGDILPEEVGSTQLPSSGNSFNPFLAGNDFGSSSNDNPFSSGFSGSATQPNVFESSNATNPFALGSDSGGNVDFFSTQHESVPDQSSVNYEDIFSQPPTKPQPEIDLFGQDINEKHAFIQEDLYSANTEPNNIFSGDYESGFEEAGRGPPRRPPPPRPGPPGPSGPPKETKDLILSVTGAMEATSSHMLDRLQATRTPSPTPMRDLHSPSPTQFGDLLEVDEPSGITGPVSQINEKSQEVNFLGDDFDFGQQPVQQMEDVKRSSIDNTIAPITPVPLEVEPVQPVTPLPSKPAKPPPARPAPPSVPDRPKIPPQHPRPPVPVRPKTPEITPSVTPQQILSPPQPPIQKDTNGFDDVFGEIIPNIPSATQTAAFPTSEVPKATQEPIESISNLNQTLDEGPAPYSLTTEENSSFTSIPVLNASLPPTTPPAPPPSANVVMNEYKTDIFDMGFSGIESNKPQSNDFFEQTKTTPDIGLSSEANGNAFDQVDFPAGSDSGPQSYNIFDAFNSSSQLPKEAKQDDFDAFAAKFDSVGFVETVTKKADPFDPFSSGFSGATAPADGNLGFGAEDNFDNFLSLREPPPVPQGTPARVSRGESAESNEDNEFNIFIKPKTGEDKSQGPETLPSLAPPPKSPSGVNAFQDTSPRFNPFDNTQEVPFAATENLFAQGVVNEETRVPRTDSTETPPTPLFDEDVSQPLEPFPRITYEGPGWEMQLRQPNKKKITGQRFWKKIFIKMVFQGENPVLQLFNGKDDKDPFQELPLQPCYSVSEIGAQQYDQYGKIFTVKLQFIFYKERPGVRPGQVTKAERITNKLSQFAAYAIQGDYQGCKEFGSDLKKLGLPVEHAPQISQLFKIGSQTYEDMKQFSMCVEEALFRLSAHRDRALNYKMEEVQITAVDELYVEQSAHGGVDKQIARVRLFFLGFLSGMPDVELGVNDLVRQGKEVVGRHDIIPVVTEEWIRLEIVEFHSCVQQDEYERTRTIRFKPPDACYIELMRFRVRPPRNRELPLQLKVSFCVTGNKVEIHGDILVPGFSSRKLGQIPCEDVMVRIPIPECWIYQFRVEKHFRYGSVKSAHRRTGKVKGIERFLGAVDNMEPQLMETTSGTAKYEHQHHAIVWRMPRLPKEGQGAYTTHNLVVRLQLTSYDQIPDELAKYAYVEFTMPATTVSHTTVRSVSIQNSDSDGPPEKYVRHLSRHEYRVEVEHTHGEGPADYIAATITKPAPITEEPKPTLAPPPASDSDSDSG